MTVLELSRLFKRNCG